MPQTGTAMGAHDNEMRVLVTCRLNNPLKRNTVHAGGVRLQSCRSRPGQRLLLLLLGRALKFLEIGIGKSSGRISTQRERLNDVK